MYRHRVSVLPRAIIAMVALTATVSPSPPRAQEPPPPPPQGAPAPLPPEQLDSLVAPIALYPDELLSQVLAASTYPLEVVEAARWVKQNPGLQGEALTQAARSQPWDPSVQALVVFPDVLNRLDQNLTWTTDLGNAYLDQQQDVMDAVQRMRQEAQERGALASNQAETVSSEALDSGQTAIDIEPANPEVVYVPNYNPAAIWGPAAYYPYPVLYYPPQPAIVFGAGFVMPRYYPGWRGWREWGWGWNWRARSPYVNNTFFYRYSYRPGGYVSRDSRFSTWAHDPVHRTGVPYRTFRPPTPRPAVPGPRPAGGARFGPTTPSRLPEARPGQPGERFGSRDVTPSFNPPNRSAFGVDTRDRAEIDSSRGRASMNNSRSFQPRASPTRASAPPPTRPSPPPVRLAPSPPPRAPVRHR